MKKHNACKVVLLTIFVFLLLTWILPAAYYSGEYIDQGRVQMGLFDVFSYPLTAISYFGYIAFFLILVGGFYGILYKIPAYRTFLDRIVAKVQGKEKFVLSAIVILMALLVSICGGQFGIALFVPFVVALILLMGYDKMTAALVVVGSICAGIIGNTYADSSSGVLTSALSLSENYQIGVRYVLLVLGIVLVIFNTLMYLKHQAGHVKVEKKTVKKAEEKVAASKVEVSKKDKKSAKKAPAKSAKPAKTANKKSTKKSSSKSRRRDNKAALKDEDIIVVKESMTEEEFVPKTVSQKHKIWPFVVAFSLLFVLFVMAFISWSNFGVQAFDNVTKSMQEYELFGFPIFTRVLGTINSFGNWSITDMFLPMALVVLFLAFVYKVRFEDVVDGFVEGAKRALGPAVIVILLYTVLVLVTYHPFQLVVYKTILGWTKGFNIVTTTLLAILCGFFNSDIAYSFQSVLPYYVSVVTKVEDYSTVGIIFQSMYGLTMMVAPTSLILMATLSYLRIPYKTWVKNVWKLLLELFVILLIVFIILALI